MFKTKKRLEETDSRIQVLEKRLEDYRREIKQELKLLKKLNNEFELKITEDIKQLKKNKRG